MLNIMLLFHLSLSNLLFYEEVKLSMTLFHIWRYVNYSTSVAKRGHKVTKTENKGAPLRIDYILHRSKSNKIKRGFHQISDNPAIFQEI